jgi:hypothetical protein
VSPGGGIAFANSFALGRVIAIHRYPERTQESLFIAYRQCRATEAGGGDAAGAR